MVYRIYVEKKAPYASEANQLLEDIRSFLGIRQLTGLRIVNRYDVEHIAPDIFEACKKTVFSEPQVDDIYNELPKTGAAVFAVENLPGQFDQRADSAAQCVQIISQGPRPTIRAARIYILEGELTPSQFTRIKKHVINPVDSREASMDLPESLELPVNAPEVVPVLDGFITMDSGALEAFIHQYGLAMDFEDIRFCQAYFRKEGRSPTLTEIRVIDTYWSDHCRHTTFHTALETVEFEHDEAQRAFDRYMALRRELNIQKPPALMDIATIGAKYLKSVGKLADLDESEEVNACTVRIRADVDGEMQDWLLFFKNETHNHPTEIEPFGGAATCIGGAIRDPLSGRGYVYQAMRVTGAADPLTPAEETMLGKLPQRKIVTSAAEGYSSYGNQIGVATGLVDEIYHPGYAAKHMEIGAVLGAAPAKNVRRETPAPGDVVILIGGRTGRDGCGGATGSSKKHEFASLEQCGAEVQKGNAPEERKLQRLFRDPEAARMIKRCNDFGAGGVSVAIGELADGMDIDLNAVPKKYEGLDGTELAISESQERMAAVLSKEDAPAFIRLAGQENLEATPVAVITDTARLRMKWNGAHIVNISREFLNTNGAPKSARAFVEAPKPTKKELPGGTFGQRWVSLATSLNVCSKRGLAERFDSTIGCGAVFMPFGGKRQLTPVQAMVSKLPVLNAQTKTCSVMAYGYDPYLSEADPYLGAYMAVVESVAKLAAAGADLQTAHLSFQEYFGRPGAEPTRWGKPLAALLGALRAQLDLGIAAIGGKDSMSGSFENIDVPPTLVSFAVALSDINRVVSPQFKRTGSTVAILQPETGLDGATGAVRRTLDEACALIRSGKALSAYAVTGGGAAEGLLKMCLGNRIGVRLNNSVSDEALFGSCLGGLILELADGVEAGVPIGVTQGEYTIVRERERVRISDLEAAYEAKLEPVYPVSFALNAKPVHAYRFERARGVKPAAGLAKPRAVIPVFPGTNCEYDSAWALKQAGALPEVCVIRNLSAADISESAERFACLIDNAQILFIPGGFSSGDEPDGSGKFITAFMRSPQVSDAIARLIQKRDGLILGICNGFQALLKLGLIPFGEIRPMDESCPTLTLNAIGRHQSRLVHTRVSSNLSPWLMHSRVGDVHLTPVSHGEGRFICSPELLRQLEHNGQIATQYSDEAGTPSMDISINPNGSVAAVEGITSRDGRIFGKMAHSERVGPGLYQNVPGNSDNRIFQGAVDYFR